MQASIGSQLNLRGATLTNKGGKALNLETADIKGHALLDPVTVTGEVQAMNVRIGGQLNLRGATLTNEDGKALNLEGADIKAATLLDRVTVTGEASAFDASIGGVLNLDGAILINEGGAALALQAARLGEVSLDPAAVKGTLGLEAAQIRVLFTPWKDMSGLAGSELSASGWRLGDGHGRIRHDRKAAAVWLSRDNAPEFVAQPWHELANVYERNGQPADARWMRWKAAQGVTRTSPPWSKLIRRVYGAVVGYYPLIAAVWLIVAVVASGFIVATNNAVFSPTRELSPMPAILSQFL